MPLWSGTGQDRQGRARWWEGNRHAVSYNLIYHVRETTMTEKDQIEQRIRAQWPIEQKIAKADYVIWTEAGLDVHAAQLDRILQHVNSKS